MKISRKCSYFQLSFQERRHTQRLDTCVHHGNISVQMLPQICTYSKSKKSGAGIKIIKSGNFSAKSQAATIH